MQYHETIEPESQPITLLSPEGSAEPYFARFGWAAKPGSDVTLPKADTLWTAEGGPLTTDSPVTLRWDNGEGLTFEQTIAIHDQYLITVPQPVVHHGRAAAAVAPFPLTPPEGPAEPYFARVGWAAKPGSDVTLPKADTLWTAEGGPLTTDSPVTLRWDNGEGLTFEQTIAIDDQYLFTVTQRVVNNGGAAADVAPFGLISRSGTPGTLDFYILHEGPLGVFNGALEEFDYSGDLKDEYQGSEVVIERSTTGGWFGITDKYWLAALVPHQAAELKAHFVHTPPNGAAPTPTDFLHTTPPAPPGAS